MYKSLPHLTLCACISRSLAYIAVLQSGLKRGYWPIAASIMESDPF